MRALPLTLAAVLATGPLAAQDHQPPSVQVEQWSLPGTPPVQLVGSRAGLSLADQVAFLGIPLPAGDFTLETTLAYRDVADGDVVGLALRGANGGWISLQLEQITPALLVAVRSHAPGGIDEHGRLLATTAVSGWHAGRIALRIERRGGLLQMAHASVGAVWQPLGPALADPTGGAGEIGLFAVDGAER